MYIITDVYRWDAQRDSCRRVAKPDGASRQFLLNTRNMFEIKSHDGGLHSCLLYSDNADDERENLAYMETSSTVQELIDAADVDMASDMITLPIHRKNNINLSVENKTILADKLSYAEAYNPSPATHCWVVYYEDDFRRREVVCDLTLQDIMAFVVPANAVVDSDDTTVVDFDGTYIIDGI